MPAKNRLSEILASHEADLLQDWLALQKASASRKTSAADDKVTASLSREFLSGLRDAMQSDSSVDLQTQAWASVRDFLTNLAQSRAKSGYTPTETASFVFSLKEPLFNRLSSSGDQATLAKDVWTTTLALDRLGLFTMEIYQKTREQVIDRQQRELLELSTPVVRLWENVLALPLIGTLDSSRTQVVMQNLLEAIVSTRSDIAIIDITGVPTVDTLVAQHLLKTVAAARLMGADCIISGIRPQIAQTIIHLGVDLSEVSTKATMADAFQLALKRTGATITTSKAK
ncbi:MAG TPA: STAS domain-containing protein [Bryobacteraceae bacterium]|jgi:rsbT co-antagonist protein RsbR